MLDQPWRCYRIIYSLPAMVEIETMSPLDSHLETEGRVSQNMEKTQK